MTTSWIHCFRQELPNLAFPLTLRKPRLTSNRLRLYKLRKSIAIPIAAEVTQTHFLHAHLLSGLLPPLIFPQFPGHQVKPLLPSESNFYWLNMICVIQNLTISRPTRKALFDAVSQNLSG